jgi:hypothetical protein
VNRRLHVTGSASATVDPELLADVHSVISRVVEAWVTDGNTMVGGIGPEPMSDRDPNQSIVFDWTVAQAVSLAVSARTATGGSGGRALTLRTSQRACARISESRRPDLDALLSADAVDLQLLPDTWRSGALIRRAQTAVGDILVIFGGGAGVEDLAELYRAAGRPVIPIDVGLGSSGNDAILGGQGLARKAMTNASDFFTLADRNSAESRLMQLSMSDPRPAPHELAQRLLRLLADLEPPQAFCVRLLNPKHPDFNTVEKYFREVVDPVLKDHGYRTIDLGHEPQEVAWMNAEIFERLHYAQMAFVDLTAERPNCFVELGYALGRASTTIITAKEGTSSPFDTDKLPCHTWDPGTSHARAREALEEHIDKYGKLPALVEPTRLV